MTIALVYTDTKTVAHTKTRPR